MTAEADSGMSENEKCTGSAFGPPQKATDSTLSKVGLSELKSALLGDISQRRAHLGIHPKKRPNHWNAARGNPPFIRLVLMTSIHMPCSLIWSTCGFIVLPAEAHRLYPENESLFLGSLFLL